jgi:AraC-like DNA-binding protein
MNDEKDHFLRIGSHRRERPWHLAAHSHCYCEIVVVSSGGERVKLGSGEIAEAGPGDILVFRSGVRHEEWSLPGDPLHTFFLSFSDTFGTGLPERLKDRQGRLRILCQWMTELQFAPDSEVKTMLRTCGDLFLRELRRLENERNGCLAEIVCRRVLDSPHHPPSLEELAELAKMSKFHFSRRYRQETGIPPMRDVRRLRLMTIRNLLATGNMTLKEIAEENGFRDAADLSRSFRKEYGTSPGRARSPRHGGI